MSEQNCCCSHTKIILKFKEHEKGTGSDYWECYDCRTRFWPDGWLIDANDQIKSADEMIGDLQKQRSENFIQIESIQEQINLAVAKNREFEAQGADMRQALKDVICSLNGDYFKIVNDVLHSTTLGAKILEEVERLKNELDLVQRNYNLAHQLLGERIVEAADRPKELTTTQQKLAAANSSIQELLEAFDEPVGSLQVVATRKANAVLKDADASGEWVSVNGELVKAMESALENGDESDSSYALSILRKARSTSTQGTK